jgi:hypothetical protein
MLSWRLWQIDLRSKRDQQIKPAGPSPIGKHPAGLFSQPIYRFGGWVPFGWGVPLDGCGALPGFPGPMGLDPELGEAGCFCGCFGVGITHLL